MIPLASDMITTPRIRGPDVKSLYSLKAWTSGILLRDLRDRDVDAPVKEIPTAAPSKLTLIT